MKRLLIASTMVASLFASSSLLAAETSDTDSTNKSWGMDKYYLRIGAFIPLASRTQVRADTNYFLSATIDTEKTLGQDRPDITPRIEAYWRYHPNHSLGFTYYKLDQNGSKIIEEELVFDEETTFLAGEVNSYLNQETLKLDYTYSFYRTNKVELGLSAGLHITEFDFGISGEANTFEPDGTPIGTGVFAKTGVDVTALLPVVGFKLNYNFTPRTRLLYKTDIFALRFDKYKGSLVDTGIMVEYQAWKHVGIGGGLNSIQIQAESDEDNGTVGFQNRVLGAQLYLTLNY